MLNFRLREVGLSNREVEVAKIVSTGASNKEAAGKLFVTEKTVKFHLTNIYKKMKIKSRSQLIVWCAPYMEFIEKEDVPQQHSTVYTGTKLPEGNV